jgi:hypothetical protein
MRKITTSFGKVALVAIFTILLTSVIPILAVDYTVGVKVGDWVKYGEISVTWTGTGTEPSEITEAKKIDWMKGEVKTVSGTQVTSETTGQYENGTTYPSSSSTIDVATGQGGGGYMTSLIAANLNEGDSITQQAGAITINGTVTSTYCKASRSVNYVDISVSQSGTTYTYKMYWDKATGVLVEFYVSQSTTTPTTETITMSYKATETNMWSADVLGLVSTYFIYIVGIVVLVVVIVVGVFMIRRRKPTPTVTPTPTAAEAKPE